MIVYDACFQLCHLSREINERLTGKAVRNDGIVVLAISLATNAVDGGRARFAALNDLL